MNPSVKRHIKLLAERFEHQVQFDRNAMIISNSSNTIRIEEYKKYDLEITYNINNSTTKTERVPQEEPYDLIIKILTRYEMGEVKFRLGNPIQIQDWIEEERYKSTRIVDLQRWILKEKSDHVILGGNRLEAEYFKGVIILMDDIVLSPCNVVDFPLEG